jgi:hypothetical protein
MTTNNPFGGLSPDVVLEQHNNSDVDSARSAQHHTLGEGPLQASPGNAGVPLNGMILWNPSHEMPKNYAATGFPALNGCYFIMRIG